MLHFQQTKDLLNNSQFYYIITTSMDGNYSYVNNNYAQAFGHINKHMVGQPYYITMHPDDMKVCEQTADKCFQNPGRSFPATIRKHDGKGGYINTQWEYRAMFDEYNQPAGVFCLGYDITQHVAANQELADAKSEIEQKAQVLEKIGWQQSHIIRKPLANIIGLVGILNKMEMDQNMTNIFAMLLQSAEELDAAITGIVSQASESN